MERFRDDELAATLRTLRPTPRPAFAAELDERAAAGFPRRSRRGTAAGRLIDRARSLRTKQVLIPACATALAAVAVATAVVALREPTGNDAVVDQVAAGGRRSPSESQRILPFSRPVKPLPETMKHSWEAANAASSAVGGAHGASASATGTAERLSKPPPASFDGSGPYAVGAPSRKVESAVQMVLGTEPTAVADDAGRVFEAVHAYDGIVMRSSIRGGAEGSPRAEFELLIPSAKLNDALSSLSEIGEVRYRHEATADITAPTVNVGEQLQDSQARIDSLIAQLAGAETEPEREAVEAELRGERAHAAALRSRLSSLHRRANLSRLSLRIESGDSPPRGSSSWGIGDALHDAGRILGIAAAIALVSLAVLAPITLIALLGWLTRRAWVRHGRERALS